VHECAHAPAKNARPSNPHLHKLHTLLRSSIHTTYMYGYQTCTYARLHHIHFYITAYTQHAHTYNICVHVHVRSGLCDMHSCINTCVFRLQHCSRIRDRRKSWALPKGSSRNFSPPPPLPCAHTHLHTQTYTRTVTHKHTETHTRPLTHALTHATEERAGHCRKVPLEIALHPPNMCTHTLAHTHAHTHTHTPTHPLTHSSPDLRTYLHDRRKSWALLKGVERHS